MESNQLQQKKQHDAEPRDWELNPSDELFVRNQEDKWLPAVIQRKTEPLSFHNLQMAEVEMSQLRLHNVHVVAPERLVAGADLGGARPGSFEPPFC